MWKLKFAVVVALFLVMSSALLWFAHRMQPVKEGNSAAFWYAACRIPLEDGNFAIGYIYEPREGWYVYEFSHMHGSHLFRVSVENVLADLPRVVRFLQEAPPNSLHPDAEAGYRAWLRIDPTRSDGRALVEQIRLSKTRRIVEAHPELASFLATMESQTEERWQRGQRYHWNVIAEFLFLGGLILLTAWPWLRRSGPVRWAIHLGALPLLFLLPFWLGYAPLAFTSAGPVGGCLYPWLLALFRVRGLPWTRLDTAIVSNLPPLLEPLTQTPGPIMVLSGGRGIGPVVAGSLGILLSALPFVSRAARKLLTEVRPASRAVGFIVTFFLLEFLR